MRRTAPVLLLLAGVALSARAEEDHEIFTCTDANGEISFQDDPCEVPEPVKPKIAAAPAKAAARAPSPAPKARSASRPAGKTWMLSNARPAPAPPPLTSVPWEPTWRAFVEAMSRGDAAAAVRCLTADALTDLGPRIQSSSPEALRAMVAPFERVVVEGDAGPYWSIRVIRAGARPKWVFFERTARGEWKIAAI